MTKINVPLSAPDLSGNEEAYLVEGDGRVAECEFHDLSRLTDPAFRARARRVFEKLDKHFAPVHVHGNNCGRLRIISNIPLPDFLEVTFASRGRYSFTETNEVFPTSLDTPNYPDSADIVLGAFRF
jgi:hypothetical protein